MSFSLYVRKAFFCIALASSSLVISEEVQNCVTYEFSGGRFGDNLLTYLHAKWISYRYDLPLCYKPFLYSSLLALDDFERSYEDFSEPFSKQILLDRNVSIRSTSAKKPVLYVTPYFPHCSWEIKSTRGGYGEWKYFFVDWKDPGFQKITRQMVLPKKNYRWITPPKESVNIAIHLRNGGTFDTGNFAEHFLTKFPPLDFYLDALLQTIDFFKGKQIYCYLFTDAAEPEKLIELFQEKIPSETMITFDWRKENNVHNRNVLEDFFSLLHFDVLIHPHSNFSVVPSLIHDYAISYSPLSGKKIEGKVIIDQVRCLINQSLYKKALQK